MGEPIKWDKPIKACLKWILMLSLSPLAFLLFLLAALFSLLRFLFKVALLFIVVAITTPFLVMYNLSVLVWTHLKRFQKPSPTHYYLSDPRASLGIEVKILVSDFMKQVAGELLVAVSTGIITYFTAPLYAFYVTLIAGVVVVFHKWLNTDCLSKTALSCLCDGYGLSPLMFLFSFIGLFDIGCHPVAKCSFAASRAFLFVEDEPNQSIEKSPGESNGEQDRTKVNEEDGPPGTWSSGSNSPPEELQVPTQTEILEPQEVRIALEPSSPPSEELQVPIQTRIGEPVRIALKPSSPLSKEFQAHATPCMIEPKRIALKPSSPPSKEFQAHAIPLIFEPKRIAIKPSNPPSKELKGQPKIGKPIKIAIEPSSPPSKVDQIEVNMKTSDKEVIVGIDWHQFNDAMIASERVSIEFPKWNAFERGLFQLNPRIDFITLVFTIDDIRRYRYILKSFMVLKLFELNLCEYPIERLELPEDYSKTNELFNFLITLSDNDGFVTNKMRGRYEHSLTLLEITEGVEKSKGYKIVHPTDGRFVVAGCMNAILGA